MSQFITESSLSRIWKHNELHDCGAISAFRNKYTRDQNEKRTKSLLSKLTAAGYSVTKLVGMYPEKGEPKKEISFWVVDHKDSGNLFKTLVNLGEEFEQQSILFAPKGTISGKSDKAFLYGLSDDEGSYPSKGQKHTFDTAKLGYNSPIYTSMINGRPFLFEEVTIADIATQPTGFGSWGNALQAKKHWSEL